VSPKATQLKIPRRDYAVYKIERRIKTNRIIAFPSLSLDVSESLSIADQNQPQGRGLVKSRYSGMDAGTYRRTSHNHDVKKWADGCQPSH
jgi:hypothetical protein